MKTVYKIGMRLILLIVPFFLICPILIPLFPMQILDGEYAWYRQNQDWSEKHEQYCRVLIMGDSIAKAAWLPRELSEDSYNFALGGASPIEEYYYLYEYLMQNDAPEYVIYTQTVKHFIYMGALWTRSVYFRRMNWDYLDELLADPEIYNDKVAMGEGNLHREEFLYRIYSPTKYMHPILKALLYPNRGKINCERYETVVENKGQTQFGTEEFYDRVDEDMLELTSFRQDKVLDLYFRKIIELCEEKGIQFIYQGGPINKSTYVNISEQFSRGYTEYMANIQKNYPDAMIDERLFSYDDCYFGDQAHLNLRGSVKFSREMREKYREIFETGGEL